jgi:hypothetical protein
VPRVACKSSGLKTIIHRFLFIASGGKKNLPGGKFSTKVVKSGKRW